jgi:hypothetical protein
MFRQASSATTLCPVWFHAAAGKEVRMATMIAAATRFIPEA